MKIIFLGAAGTVTGSKCLITFGETRLLVDCGLFQGLKELRLKNWSPLPVDPHTIDAVILTHAHLDHSGWLPLLIKQGFKGKVYCTPGTRDLCKILLPDSGYLQEEEARYANRHEFSKHKPALPLYTEDDAKRSLSYLSEISFHSSFEPMKGIKVTFFPAGHILGAAIICLQSEGKKIVFSGDLGRPHDPIMQPPEEINSADDLIVESTYGGKQHDSRDPLEALAEVIHRTVARGGIIIAPAFAVGRAQTLMYYIWRLKKEHRIPDIPVFLNSPMAIAASRLYFWGLASPPPPAKPDGASPSRSPCSLSRSPCEYHPEHRLSEEECKEVCGVAKYVETMEESQRLNSLSGPALIISASGMATGGRVLHHLKFYAPHANNTILLSGYQAAGTRGEALAHGDKLVKIHGIMVPIRAEVVVMENLSAHADAPEILAWLSHFKKAPRMTFLIHGEETAREALKKRIQGELGWSCTAPAYLETHLV